MAFQIRATTDALIVELQGLDRVLCWRRRISIPLAGISAVRHLDRADVEPTLSHRLYGVGGHRGDRHQGRKRVGSFMGRPTAAARQFWAVEKGQDTVLVIHSDDSTWQRLVVDPTRCTDDVLQLAT